MTIALLRLAIEIFYLGVISFLSVLTVDVELGVIVQDFGVIHGWNRFIITYANYFAQIFDDTSDGAYWERLLKNFGDYFGQEKGL